MSPESLFDAGKKERWRGSRELVPLPAETCPACGEPLHEQSVSQPALLIHGDYGQTITEHLSTCPCGWTLDRAKTSESPRA